MKKLNQDQNVFPVRGLRLSDENWREFSKMKKRGQSWELFIREIREVCKIIKSWDDNK